MKTLFVMLVRLLIFMLIILTFQEKCLAFFHKSFVYRRDDTRPLFFEQQSSGVIYVTGGFTWLTGKINDVRGLGGSEAMNQSFYNLEQNYSATSPTYSNNIKSISGGYISLGYTPRGDGFSRFFRHEIEIGRNNSNQTYNHISNAHLFTYDSKNYSSLSYTMDQKYTMYNLYIQPNMQDELSMFFGAGIGAGLTSISFSGTETTDDGSGNITTTKVSNFIETRNILTPVYSIFIGATYDLSDAIVIQSKVKAIFYGKPNESYSNKNYESQSRYMAQFYGFDLSVLFGM